MRTSWAGTHKGFSLVELLTVIAIIALIISIVLPVLGGAREAGRKVSTQGLLNDIAGAAAQFRLDHQGRNPGYFSPREMGHVDNATRGLSEMENVLLELAGTGAIMEETSANTVAVGPIADETINVDPSLLGAEGAYFTPSGEFYVAQLRSAGQQVGEDGHTAESETEIQLLDMIDAFGQPLLFWSADDYTMTAVNRAEDFVRQDTSDEPALFYWNSNAAFLKAANLGRKGQDMTQPAGPDRFSLIGGGAIGNDPDHTMLSMQALLGSPSAPRAPAPQTVEDLLADPAAGLEALYPGRAKGAFLIHSAGSDGIYLSSEDRGFRTVAHEDDHIDFGLNFFTGPDGRVTDDDNNPTSRDIISEFDDITVSGGG